MSKNDDMKAIIFAIIMALICVLGTGLVPIDYFISTFLGMLGL